MIYNPAIHHRRSIRLKGYDYSQAGLYFITICCYNRECLFGDVVNGEMVLNDAGKFADECWNIIPDHFPNAILHEYIIMPNHIHGIIELLNNIGCTVVGVQNFEPLQSPNEIDSSIRVQNFEPVRNEFQKIIPKSIGSIVRGFKIGVTKWFRENSDRVENNDLVQNIGSHPFRSIWQRNYHEHIIRNEKSYQTIAEYIVNNSSKWNDDKFYIK